MGGGVREFLNRTNAEGPEAAHTSEKPVSGPVVCSPLSPCSCRDLQRVKGTPENFKGGKEAGGL